MAIIKRRWIQYYDYNFTNEQVQNLTKIMRVDPSGKDKETNDEFAISILGVNNDTGQIYELESYSDHIPAGNAQMKVIFSYAEKWFFKPKDYIHIEVNQAEALKNDFEAYCKKTQRYYTVKGIHTGTDKTTRLKGVSGMIENGYVKFKTGGNEDLITQLTQFGKTRFDDLMDAFVGALEGLQESTPAFLTALKERAEEAKKKPEELFIDKYKSQMQVYG